MKRITIFLLAGCLASCMPQQGLLQAAPDRTLTPAARPIPADAWVILNGILIDGAGHLPITDGALVIEGDRILAAGPVSDFDITPEIRVIDAKGGAILPGIIDAHVHLGSPPITRRFFLQEGVTSLCDTGDSLPMMPEFEIDHDSSGLAARGFKSGPMLTAADALPGDGGGFSWSLEIRTPQDGRAAVDQLVDQGADYIKVALDPGDPAFPRPVLDADTLQAIVDEAHARGRLVRAHARLPELINRALDAGVDGIEHVPVPAGYDLRAPLPPEQPVELPAELEQTLERMAREGVTLTPTLDALAGAIYTRPKPDAGQQSELRFLLAVVNRFHQLGGVIAVGNDYGTADVMRGLPLTEMRMLEAAGLTPMQVIEAATRNAAFICGQGSELGTLEAGKLADVIILRSSPYTGMDAFQHVQMVIRGGVVVYPPNYVPRSRP